MDATWEQTMFVNPGSVVGRTFPWLITALKVSDHDLWHVARDCSMPPLALPQRHLLIGILVPPGALVQRCSWSSFSAGLARNLVKIRQLQLIDQHESTRNQARIPRDRQTDLPHTGTNRGIDSQPSAVNSSRIRRTPTPRQLPIFDNPASNRHYAAS